VAPACLRPWVRCCGVSPNRERRTPRRAAPRGRLPCEPHPVAPCPDARIVHPGNPHRDPYLKNPPYSPIPTPLVTPSSRSREATCAANRAD